QGQPQGLLHLPQAARQAGFRVLVRQDEDGEVGRRAQKASAALRRSVLAQERRNTPRIKSVAIAPYASVATNLSIARLVSAGASSCGKWPTPGTTTTCAAGTLALMKS